MAISPKILKQLGHPQGLTGRLILRLLNRANAPMNRAAFAALALRDQDNILEIGFGGGALVQEILNKHRNIRITGCDISALAVKKAKRRARKDPRARFLKTEAEGLPFARAEFTKVVCVNVIYFWQDQARMLAEIAEVLQPGGRVVLGYSEFGPEESTRFEPAKIEANLLAAGFASAYSIQIDANETEGDFCTVGIKA